MNNHVLLSVTTISSLSPACKNEIAAALGLEVVRAPISETDGEEGEYAELGLQAARAFLLNCSERTTQTLAAIVETGGEFSLRALERKMNVEESGLRGVWTGLTKRTRTITGDPDAMLIEWSDVKENGDYSGKLTATSLSAFRRALEE